MELTIAIQTFLELGIVAAGLALAIQWVKTKLEIGPDGVKLIVIVFSLIIGTLFYLFQNADWFISVLGILAASQTVWALMLKKDS